MFSVLLSFESVPLFEFVTISSFSLYTWHKNVATASTRLLSQDLDNTVEVDSIKKISAIWTLIWTHCVIHRYSVSAGVVYGCCAVWKHHQPKSSEVRESALQSASPPIRPRADKWLWLPRRSHASSTRRAGVPAVAIPKGWIENVS